LRTFEEQFERVKRWYVGFEKIDQGKAHHAHSDYYQDDVYAFFLNCYHLKDWIKNDHTVPGPVRGKVEDFINKSDCLKICADICNALKHLELKRPPRGGKTPDWIGRKFQLLLGGGQPTLGVKYSLMTGKGPKDAFELAEECVREWEQFIKANIT